MRFDIEHNKAYLREMLNDAEKERKSREVVRSLSRHSKTQEQHAENTDTESRR